MKYKNSELEGKSELLIKIQSDSMTGVCSWSFANGPAADASAAFTKKNKLNHHKKSHLSCSLGHFLTTSYLTDS